MNEVTAPRYYVYSSLGTDPVLGDLVELFVREIPGRVDTLQQAWEAQDWDTLGRATHQLKGAAGSYGFEDLTLNVHELDHLVRTGRSHGEISRALAEVIDLCSRVRAGGPE